MTPTSINDNSLAIWSALAAALLAALAVPLTLFPRLLLLLSDDATEPRTSLTHLEAFLALHFGLFLAALALALLLNVPSPKAPLPMSEDSKPTQPLLVPLTIVANVSAFLAWNDKNVGALASVVFVVDFVIGIWGLWAIVFANSGAISKTTGADKHTSAFIFGNKAAASSQKKIRRKGE
ncbi:unnamed protein product [Cyclocybe aegerita]|uniref:Uncharacterized protein n=1 Tax=Cyclocybe aegerita TaxID=1973307 RepID=A0A8S0Y131_CYCAE|nr:unnamed protein product [Cyclocybe aegerita]